MGASAVIGASSILTPEKLTGTEDRSEFKLISNISITSDVNSIVRLLFVPDDFEEGSSSTEPQVTMDIKDGSDPGEVDVTVAAGGGAENIEYTIIQKTAGEINDFTLVRAVHIRAIPITAVTEENPSKCKALLYMGNTGGDVWDRFQLPVGYDSTASDGSYESTGLLAIPRGLAYAEANPLVLKIYQALNTQLVLSLLG